MTFILNKKKYPNIKLNGGGDMCDPTLNGLLLDSKNVPVVNIPFWNYDSSFKSKNVIAEDRARFAELGITTSKIMVTGVEKLQSWLSKLGLK